MAIIWASIMSTQTKKSEVKILHGSRSYVLHELQKIHSEKLLAIQADHFKASEFKQFGDNISKIVLAMRGVFAEKIEQKALFQIVEILTNVPVAKPHLLQEVSMSISARKAVINSGEWLSAAQITELADPSASDPSAQPNRWKKKGQIFAIKHNGVNYYPGFALDSTAGYRPLKAVKEIIDIFKSTKGSWEMAFWFQSSNSWLGGLKPQNLLANDAQSVIFAARKEVEEIVHG